MLTKSMQITLDSRTPNLKTVTCVQMAGKEWNSIVYSCFPESCASEPFRLDSRISPSGDPDHQARVSVDKRDAWRLDYRVAEKTKDFYVERIHSGRSFLSNARASNLLVSALDAPSDWRLCSLSHHVQQLLSPRDIVLVVVEMNQLKRRISGPFVVL